MAPDEKTDDDAPPSERADRPGLTTSTAPGAADVEAEATGGADAVPMTPADDGLAGRDGQDEVEVTPPAQS